MLPSTAIRSINSGVRALVHGALFLGWTAYFIYVLIRFRKGRHPVADHHGVKSAISTHLEFSVVLIEAVLLVGFAVPLWAKRVNQFPDPKDALLVHAVGQQFNWTLSHGGTRWSLWTARYQFGFRYESARPRSERPIFARRHCCRGLSCTCRLIESVIIELSSKDVIHNFAVPNMRIAGDAIPGSLIPMWFKPIKAGTYEVICGQLCGLGHYSMKGTLVVDTPADYAAWLKERAELGGSPTAAPAAAARSHRRQPRPSGIRPSRKRARL